jgi:multiple antibiotic resistance protein
VQHQRGPDLRHVVGGHLPSVIGGAGVATGVLAVVLAITLGVLLLAAPLWRLIGDAGASIISRVMGMILVALAVHTILSAFATWLGLPKL